MGLKRTCHRQTVLSSHPVGSVTTMKRCILFALGLLVITTPYSRAGQGSVLRNPGFESRVPLEDWQVVTYGSSAAAELDAHEVHEGAQSLRISAALPSDTALGQDMSLRPGAWYRLTGWVKTRGLTHWASHGLVVRFRFSEGGRGKRVAGGPKPIGRYRLEPRRAHFSGPSRWRGPSRTRSWWVLAGPGTAWFDDYDDRAGRPEQVSRGRHTRVLRPARINPFQYGQFIEYLCTLVPGMWAEKLYDGSFEGLPYKFAYLKETDFREKPWYPDRCDQPGALERDRVEPISGEPA